MVEVKHIYKMSTFPVDLCALRVSTEDQSWDWKWGHLDSPSGRFSWVTWVRYRNSLTLNYFIFKMFVIVMTGRVAELRNLWWEVHGKVHVNCLPWVLAQRKQMKYRSVVRIRDRLQAQWFARRTYRTQDIVIFMAKFITGKGYRAR